MRRLRMMGMPPSEILTGKGRHEPFLFALGAYLIGLPVYWYNRRRMTAPGPVPPPVEARS